MSASTYDVEKARKHFPALKQPQVFLDNAGGSAVLGEVIDSIKTYLCNTNVQLGASYKASQDSTRLYNAGVQAGADYINAKVSEVVIGPSTTQLFRNLSIALRPHFPAGSEVVVSALDHEANIASWVTLAEDLNLRLKWWRPADPSSSNPQLSAENLKPLLSPQTRLVTCTHVSNLLGTISPIRAIADVIHETCPHGLLCVDGVALAPHRPIDMQALGVDMYSFSWYKLYGPHIAQLYVKQSVQNTCLRSLGHYFKSGSSLEEKLGLAGGSYELVQALPQVVEYLKQQSWDELSKHEEGIQDVLLKYLRSKPETFVICGDPRSSLETRVPVVSFTVRGRRSRNIVEKVEEKTSYGFRWGHFYSKRLNDEILGLDDEGVVRVSMVHYNTMDEIEGLVKALDEEILQMR